MKRLSTTAKYRWLVQFHPKIPKEVIEKYKSIESEYLSFIETDNVIPLLQEADLMVCDTSSVLLMFLLLNKPVVTFNNISPKDYLINISEPELLESSIEQGLTKPKELMGHIENFIQQTHPYQDGSSSERVLNAVDEVISQPQKSIKNPWNLLRQFKMRKN
ncbi:CDP-glycerol glycerophosphotransferase family protein [Pseudocolwellia sp. HL-MZ19]|uniref:CDP-glycerol glycerophosphotransferase family protein n=1 Tax=unclassified Pseudocolwellia TaxID=2848178 RepID=UPI003CF413B7